MTSDEDDNGDKQPPASDRGLPKEAIEKTKDAILHGVGYRRPPPHTRFKKGQSGNPKGRPKNHLLGSDSGRSANALALREGERLIPVREGEEVREIPAIEAVYRSQLKSATRGNAYAQKHFIERYDWGERDRRRQISEDVDLFERYVAMARQEIAEAKVKGGPPPTRLPHPDDVVIDFDKGVRIVGPRNAEELARLEGALKLRDVLIMQDELDRRAVGDPQSKDALDQSGSALVFAFVINQCAPKRFRLSDDHILFRSMRYAAMTKRVLLKELYRAWRTLGVSTRRGATFPPVRFAKKIVDEISDRLSEFEQQRSSL